MMVTIVINIYMKNIYFLKTTNILMMILVITHKISFKK